MPSNVETLFSVKKVPWHGLGTYSQGCTNFKGCN